MTVASFWSGTSSEVKITTRLRGSTWSGRGGRGFGLIPGGIWWEDFQSGSGELPKLILDYKNNQYAKDTGSGLVETTFADLHIYTDGDTLATQKDSNGNVVFKPHNRIVQSNAFATSWSQISVATPVESAIGPDGTTSGWLLLDNGAGGTATCTVQSPAFNAILSGKQRFGVWAKKDQVNFLGVQVRNFNLSPSANPIAFFDLNNGVVGSVNDGLTNVTIEDFGNGWFLCSGVYTLGASDSAGNFRLFMAHTDGVSTVTRDGTNSIFIAQCSASQFPMAAATGTFHETYVPTTTVTLLQHRLNHDIIGNRIGLLLEEERENLSLWSDDWTNAAYDTVTTMTVAKDQTGADGVSNSASSLLATGGNSLVTQSITSGSATRVYSVHIKRITGNGNIELTQDGGSTWLDIKALINSSTFTQVTTASASVTNPDVGIRIVTDTDKIAVQFGFSEIGVSKSTPIGTTTVPVTRDAELAKVLTNKFAYAAPQGTFILNAIVNGGGGQKMVQIWRGSGNNARMTSWGGSIRHLRVYNDAAQEQAALDAGSISLNTEYKLAAAYKVNDFGASLDGGTVATDTSGDVGSAQTEIKFVDAGMGTIRSYTHFASRISNADLIEGAT